METPKINPKKIAGKKWREGYCLDVHTARSDFIGHNAFGHAEFETTRTPVGDLLYKLKYRGDRSMLDPLANALAGFLSSWKPAVQCIVPVPPSNASRKVQTVAEIAERLGALAGLPVYEGVVSKVKSTGELKNIYDYGERSKVLKEAFTVDPTKIKGLGVLLLDDLYRSGATVNSIAELLTTVGKARDVFLLTVTRTRSNV